MCDSSSVEPQHKTLNINHSNNSQLYLTQLKHNLYISPFTTSLKEKHPNEEHTPSELSLRKTNLKISLPYPISKAVEWEISPDPCHKLLKNKAEYKKKFEMYKQFYKKDKNIINIKNLKEKNEGLINLPHYVVDLTINNDKNPYFDGTYDYFYTGGTLTKVRLFGETNLVSIQGKQLVLKNLDTDNIQEETLQINGPIYNIQGYNFNNSSFITLRSKTGIQIEKLNSAELTETKTIYKSNAKNVPYIDVKMLDEFQVAIANVKYGVKLYDIEKEIRPSFHQNFQFSSFENGDLCQLEVVNVNSLLFMDRSSISLVDLKSSDAGSRKELKLKNGFFQCNDLCAICLSSINANFIYVASKHNIYKCDLREMQVIKKWTHLLENSPIIIKTLKVQSDEYIFLSSFNETVCLHVSMYNHLPFKVESVANAFLYFKLHHQFILREDLDERFKLSTTGLELHGSHLFTANSIGDIFKHQITSENDDSPVTEAEAMMKLKNFIMELPETPKQLQVTHLKELSTLKSVISTSRDDNYLNIYTEPNKRLQKFLNPGIKYGKYDMAMIWDSTRMPVVDAEIENEQKTRIDDWLTQTTAQSFDYDQEEDQDM